MKNAFVSKIRGGIVAIAMACALFSFVGCSDNVDQSDMYVFTGQLMSDYLSEDESLSDFLYLTKRLKLSDRSESTVYDLLSARGNFTCFAPSNNAVKVFLDSVYNTPDYDITLTPDSMVEYIVKNALIDHKNSPALLSTEFLEGTIETQSFSGRFVTVNFSEGDDGRAAIWIDKFSRITASDIEVVNGVIHKVNRVVAPTVSSLSSLIETTPNLQVFANLLKATGYDKVLDGSFRDMVYEKNHPETGLGTPSETKETPVPCPVHRDFGFTAFVEADSLFEKEMGITVEKENGQITNWPEVLEAIKVKCKEYYPDATSDNLTSDDNAVRQFVGYHLIDRSVPFNLLNIHYSEQGFAFRRPEVLSIDTWCYYPTLIKNRIMKIMEGKEIDGKRINRYVSERWPNNYSEKVCPRQGILLHNDGDNAALNGYFYTIDEMLVYDQDVPNKVLNERMRYDVLDLLPEMSNSGYRRITSGNAVNGLNIPSGYLDNMTWNDESRVVYLSGYAKGWANYQGDEFNIVGQYDVVLKLPHVPYYGTYEFRLGIQNVALRGMCQVYFGTNPKNLEAIGLPLDMRIQQNSAVTGFETDDPKDENYNREIDKNMRNHGYMKAPKYYGISSGGAVSVNNRDTERVRRAILYTGTLDPEKTYYVRFKNVLENTSSQLFLDYIELVPKSVWAGEEGEDAW